MSEISNKRRLAAIMFTDFVGYSALSQRNEALALELLSKHQDQVRRLLPRFGGREVKSMGDGFLLEYPSALEAVRAAVEMQRVFHDENVPFPADKSYLVRIGIHLGDVVVQGDDIYGDGVNIASRIEKCAAPGGICISSAVYEQVHNKLEHPLAEIGPAELKNISIAMVLHRVVLPWETLSGLPDADSKTAASAASPKSFDHRNHTAGCIAALLRQWLSTVAPRKAAWITGSLAICIILALLMPSNEPPLPPPATASVLQRPTPADRINYVMASSKWMILSQETVASETPNKKAATGAVRGMMRELRGIVFDDPLLPEEFREAYLQWVGSNERAIDLMEEFPDMTDSWELIGFAVRVGWDAVTDSPGLKERMNDLNEKMRHDLTVLDQVAARHGARTDWEALPKILEVIKGSPAENAGIRAGDYFFSVNGTPLYRKLPPNTTGQARSGVFLSRDGMVKVNVAADEMFGVVYDTLCNEPPVIIRLIPFAIFDGYHVVLTNCSQDRSLGNVVVNFSTPDGKSKEQKLGALASMEAKSLDPSKVDWKVKPGQFITITAEGFSPRTLKTSKMIE